MWSTREVAKIVNQYVTATMLMQIRMRVILFVCVVITSIFCTTIISQSTHALSLPGVLQPIAQPLKQVKLENPVVPLPTIFTPPKTTAPAIIIPLTTVRQPVDVASAQPVSQMSPAAASSTTSHSTSAQRSGAAQKLVPIVPPKESSTSEPATPAGFLNVSSYKSYLASIGFPLGITIGDSFLAPNHSGGQSSFKFLKATSQGWELLGLLWYWWGLGAATIYAAIFGRREIMQFLFSVWTRGIKTA